MKISKTIFFTGLFLICVNLAVLTRFILFKHPEDSFHRLKHMGKVWGHPGKRGGENWVLFSTISQIYNGRLDERYKWENLGGNIIGFMPLGFLLPLTVFRRHRLVLTVIAVFGISLLFEVTQLYTGLGVFDVDDLLLNTTGGLLGFIMYLIIMLFFRPRSPQNRQICRSLS